MKIALVGIVLEPHWSYSSVQSHWLRGLLTVGETQSFKENLTCYFSIGYRLFHNIALCDHAIRQYLQCAQSRCFSGERIVPTLLSGGRTCGIAIDLKFNCAVARARGGGRCIILTCLLCVYIA